MIKIYAVLKCTFDLCGGGDEKIDHYIKCNDLLEAEEYINKLNTGMFEYFKLEEIQIKDINE